ncbi:MAG: putative LPS assembly protein LptD [Saprospiraceae bacterium]
MKHYSGSRDTVLRKRIFDNLTFTGNYNLSADTLKWSTISTGGLFRLFKGISNLTWNVTFDPYSRDEKGNRIDRFVVKETGKPVRLSRFGVQLNTGCTVKQLRQLFEKDNSGNRNARPASGTTQPDELISWFDGFRINHRVSFDRLQVAGTNRDTLMIGTNNISFSGSIPVSSKWSIDIGNISYDFLSKKIVYPDLGFSRDLHCWQLSMRWQPLRGTYEVFIGVKPGSLDFIKAPYRKNNFDGNTIF